MKKRNNTTSKEWRASVYGVAFLLMVVAAGCDGVSDANEEQDIIAPTVKLTSPALTNQGYSLVTATQTNIRGTANDNIAVTRLAYRLNDGEEQDISITTGNSVEFEFTAALEPGNNEIIISASDAAGNQAELKRIIASAVVRYDVIVAGEPDEGMMSRPRAINASGDAALKWEDMSLDMNSRDALGFVWSAGALTELVIPDGHVLMGVSGINASRVVVGNLEDVGTGTGDWRDLPVIWKYGQPTVLPLLSDYTMGGASGINDAGTIAGYVMDDGWDNWAAVLWRDGEPTLIRTDAVASDINSSGIVTGDFWGGSEPRAFRWDNGEMTTLEPFEGKTVSVGLAINDAGDVVGFSYDRHTFPHTRATLWQGTNAISLGEVPGGMYYRTWGINNHGQAVGAVDYEETEYRTAFISENGRMSLLNHLTNGEWDIIEAFGVNDEGQIVALAQRAGSNPYLNEFHSLLLDPIDAITGDAMSVYIPQQSISAEAAKHIIERLVPRSAYNQQRKSRLQH